MDIGKLQASLEHQHRAPVEQWNPPFCGDIDIRIAADGQWFYMNSPIGRHALVRLFASVLKREGSEYFLVTPAEKVRIQVDDLPFVITTWQQVTKDDKPFLQVSTNVDERYLINESHPLVIDNDLPAVIVRDQFRARVQRNVYYQWAEIAESERDDEHPGFYLASGDSRFLLAPC
ncbi:DUF1285 domain-containing protein [Aliidiomarina shirensis]|uniref:DUF1285 domain-containing protein n=1 Tax=Aliidiomarina shirensis TaxID=1048642 RepID=A0A432WQN9_9GAMM|nr:DUF1285 domain-containing protein [Aliidiomarina shirensis]RUO36071.1 DUF1285 domain-containing protein [Aliidiomarina shirensis]